MAHYRLEYEPLPDVIDLIVIDSLETEVLAMLKPVQRYSMMLTQMQILMSKLQESEVETD